MRRNIFCITIVLIILLSGACDPFNLNSPAPTPAITATPTPPPISTLNPNCSVILSFQDSNLENIIWTEINKPSGDIYLCDVESVIFSGGYFAGISDLSGIENLTSLIYLYLYYNNINDINALAGLTSLAALDLDNNNISDISPLVNNPGIDSGDTVYILSNPLNDDSINIYIPALRARGVTVYNNQKAV